MNRQWMYGDRRTFDYITGLHIFLDVAEATKQNGFMYCPCTVCGNMKDIILLNHLDWAQSNHLVVMWQHSPLELVMS